MVAPPWYTVPPDGYGGIELVVFLLTRELIGAGHDVTLFGTEDSDPSLNVHALSPGWAADLGTPRQRVREATYLARAYREIDRGGFDIVHEHTGEPGIVIAHLLRLPVLATVHGPLDEPALAFFREIHRDVDLVAISETQRAQAGGLRWNSVVHNAIDPASLVVGERKQPYLLQLARITPEKGQHLAIEAAHRVGMRLVLAGKVDKDAEAKRYFRKQVEPKLGREVQWIEDVGGERKSALLAQATAHLAPLQWEEPFGLSLVESMASGTPVIAFARGAATELVEEGLTGFLAADVDEMVSLIARAGEIDPARCAARARERFSARRMAEGYLRAYEKALQRRRAA